MASLPFFAAELIRSQGFAGGNDWGWRRVGRMHGHQKESGGDGEHSGAEAARMSGMNPAIQGRTEPPKPAVKSIQRESAVWRARAKKPARTRGRWAPEPLRGGTWRCCGWLRKARVRETAQTGIRA